MPRSSVSAAVQELESRVGVRLLHRTTRSVSTTHDGAAFYERCLQLIADVDNVETLFRQSKDQPSGKLRVDVPGRIGRLIVAPMLPDFLERYPGIDIELGVTDRTVNLIEDNIDCVLRIGALADSGLITRTIGELQIVNVASRSYLEKHGIPKSIAQLSHHVAVNFASPSTGRVESWEYVRAGTVQTLSMPGRVTVNNAEAYIACCLAGLGLIQVPAFDITNHMKTGELVEVLPKHRAAPMPVSILYPHRQHLSTRLQHFISWLTLLIQKHVLDADSRHAS